MTRLAFLFFLLLFPLPASADGTVTLFHINDVYEIEGSEKKGGFDRLATRLADERRKAPQSLLVLSGDFLSPSIMSRPFKGRQMVDMLNISGVDLATVGNHDFDMGLAVLKERVNDSRFAWVLSNAAQEGGAPLPGMVPGELRSVDGVEVGFIGVISPDTPSLVPGLQGVAFSDLAEGADQQARLLRKQGAELIVALTHLDWAEDRKLAQAVPQIDLILGGHDHDVGLEEVDGTWIVKSGSDLEVLGRVRLVRTGEGFSTEIAFLPLDGSVERNPDVTARIRHWQGKLHDELSVVIGTAEVDLDARGETNRSRETNLGNFVADAMREAVQAQVAITNGGGLRSDRVIPAGELTGGDVLGVLPFGSKVVKIEVTGSDLLAALEHGLSKVSEYKGRFLQVSGLVLQGDLAKPPGKRVVSVTVEGQPLAAEGRYVVATNDFMAAGGDGFTMLTHGKVLLSSGYGPLMATVVEAAIVRLKTVNPRVEGRIALSGP